MYSVLLERRAEKDLDSLPSDIRKSVLSKIVFLQDEPRPTGCRKLEGAICSWRIRIGNYRILYEIDDLKKTALIYRIKHRKDAYR